MYEYYKIQITRAALLELQALRISFRSVKIRFVDLSNTDLIFLRVYSGFPTENLPVEIR